MAESLNAQQRDRILQLGAWRDEGRQFAVGKDGEVSKHKDQKENSSGYTRKGTARREGPTRGQGATASGSASAPDPPGAVGSESLIAKYKAHLDEVRLYLHVQTIDTEEGIWLIVPMWPIGKPGPRFTIALHLPHTIDLTPTAFGFRSSGQLTRAISTRHTNSPEGSICAWSDGDIDWRPGDSPLLLLLVYADWLLCQLFYQSEGYWPGPQTGMAGMEAIYRWNEFRPKEWCDCGSQKRYGDCHQSSDAATVAFLKAQGKSVAPPVREIPPSILAFARSGWKKLPPPEDLPIRVFGTS